jgi:ABC-type sulfate/molybdate transport systems ATPase subunit
MLNTRYSPVRRKSRRSQAPCRLFPRYCWAKQVRQQPPQSAQWRPAPARCHCPRLAVKPAIILADEPTANLDKATGREILKLMKQINRHLKTTFIFSTHDQKVIDHADRLVQMEDGSITAFGVRAMAKHGIWPMFATFRKATTKMPLNNNPLDQCTCKNQKLFARLTQIALVLPDIRRPSR